jgi:hypothetical protein
VVDLPEMPETPSVFGYAQFVWNHIVREGSVIRRAPMAFIISMLIVGTPLVWVMYNYIKAEFAEQIDDLRAANEKLDATAKTLQATIEYQDHKLAGSINTPAGPSIGGISKLQYNAVARLPPLYPVRINIYYTNVGTISAKGAIFGGDAEASDKELKESDLDIIFAGLKYKLKDAESRNLEYELQPGDHIFYTIQSSTITQTVSDELNGGKGFLYMFALMEYKDENTPPGKFRVTEVCLIGLPKSADHFCPYHNRVFLSD